MRSLLLLITIIRTSLLISISLVLPVLLIPYEDSIKWAVVELVAYLPGLLIFGAGISYALYIPTMEIPRYLKRYLPELWKNAILADIRRARQEMKEWKAKGLLYRFRYSLIGLFVILFSDVIIIVIKYFMLTYV